MSGTSNTPNSGHAIPAEPMHPQNPALSATREDQVEPEQPPLPDESFDADDLDLAPFDNDDCWDVFIADDDELDPQPEPGDFWIEPD
jgi:hypothetical protein